jgi:predicted phage terminase large subunit-like protein
MCVTETFPSYFLGLNPDKRVIELSYGDELAQRFGKLNRDKLSEFGPAVFGTSLSSVQATKTNWGIAGTDGGMISSGIGGTVTGYGADLLIVDDPIKNRQEAESTTFRERLWDEYQSTVATRLHAGGTIVIILTRWHEDDLAARLLNPEFGKPEDWKVISLPAICESENDILGRNIGQALWVNGGYDEEWADQKKESVGSYAWSSLYQQHPTPSSGGIFKRGWWQRWKEQPGDLIDYIQSWDFTFKDKNTSDYVVGQVWARSRKNPANRYLLDQVRGRWSFTESVSAMEDLTAKWKQTTRKLIEDKANGSAVIDVLKKKIHGIIPVEPMGGKVVRAHAVTANVEAGNVYIPDASIAPWANDFIEELSSFPSGAHDDQVDAMTQANAYYNDRGKFDIRTLNR